MKKILLALVAGIMIAVSVVACSPKHSTTIEQHVTTQQSAQAKSDAKALARCLPTGATQQIELAHSLTTHSGREALTTKCGIGPQHKQAFEASVLSAAESGHLTSKSGRTVFFSVTLPKLVEANQG